MKITDVTVQLVQSDDGRKWTHVRVFTDEGVSGIGEATYSMKETVVAEMVRALKDRVIGRDPFEIEQIYLDLYAHGRAGYRTGGVMFTSAISGIDQALWDLKGKLLGVPVSALLGGPREARIPVYTHFHGATMEERVADAQARVSEGFNGVKSNMAAWIAPGPRVSRAELRQIDKEYDALRSALGDDIHIMDDAHAAYDAQSALEVSRVLEPYRLLFFEEPTIPEDRDGYRHIHRGSTTPIAGSERLTSKFAFHEFFKSDAVDIAQPDIVYIGGITEMKKVCAIAELYQVVIAPHNTKGPVGIMAAAHVMAAIPNPLIQEFIAPRVIPWRNDVLKDPLDIKDSALLVRDRPGLGIEFDEDALKAHIIG